MLAGGLCRPKPLRDCRHAFRKGFELSLTLWHSVQHLSEHKSVVGQANAVDDQ